jgi:hypothetical protein
VAGAPQLREAGWFVTGRDADPVRHLFIRLEERTDGSGTWTVELHLCQARRDRPGTAMRTYATEADARAALQAIYQLSRHLVDLPTWDHTDLAPGRWKVRTVGPTPQDLQMRRRNRAAA